MESLILRKIITTVLKYLILLFSKQLIYAFEVNILFNIFFFHFLFLYFITLHKFTMLWKFDQLMHLFLLPLLKPFFQHGLEFELLQVGNFSENRTSSSYTALRAFYADYVQKNDNSVRTHLQCVCCFVYLRQR